MLDMLPNAYKILIWYLNIRISYHQFIVIIKAFRKESHAYPVRATAERSLAGAPLRASDIHQQS